MEASRKASQRPLLEQRGGAAGSPGSPALLPAPAKSGRGRPLSTSPLWTQQQGGQGSEASAGCSVCPECWEDTIKPLPPRQVGGLTLPWPATSSRLLASLICRRGTSPPPRVLRAICGCGRLGRSLSRGAAPPVAHPLAPGKRFHPVKAPSSHLRPDCPGREQSARLKGSAEIRAVPSPRPHPVAVLPQCDGCTGPWRQCQEGGQQGADHPTHPLTPVNHSGPGFRAQGAVAAWL